MCSRSPLSCARLAQLFEGLLKRIQDIDPGIRSYVVELCEELLARYEKPRPEVQGNLLFPFACSRLCVCPCVHLLPCRLFCCCCLMGDAANRDSNLNSLLFRRLPFHFRITTPFPWSRSARKHDNWVRWFGPQLISSHVQLAFHCVPPTWSAIHLMGNPPRPPRIIPIAPSACAYNSFQPPSWMPFTTRTSGSAWPP